MNKLFIGLLTLLFSNLLFAQTLEDQLEGTKQLTDEEQNQANNYVHTGKIEALIAEECKNNEVTKKYGCGEESVQEAGQAIKGQGGAMAEAMIPQLYSMMGMLGAVGSKSGAGPNDIKMKPKANAPKPTDGSKAEGESKQDVCIYIPMAGEMVMKTTQSMAEKKISESNPDETDIQRESLLKVARIHEARAKTAIGQSVVYGSTTGCYAAYLATGAVFDVKMGIKIAASGALTALYAVKANNHKKYQKALEYIASKLPGKGECNPFTKTSCFCSEPTSKEVDPTNFTKVCIPNELAHRDPKKNPTPCFVSGPKNIPQPDFDCKCKQTNSCFQHSLGNMMLEMGIGNNYLQDSMNGLNLVGGGEFDEAKMNAFSEKYQAIGRKLMNQKMVGDIPVANTKKSNTSASDFTKLGLNPGLADLAASLSPSGAPGTGAMPSSAPSFRSKDFIKDVTGSQNYNPKYASVSTKSGSRNRRDDGFVNPFAKKNKDQNGGVIEIGELEEQAMKEADITKNSDVHLFDIITYRYQRSGRERLKLNP